MAELRIGKLQASTLLESIIAMMIIMMVFSIAMGIHIKVQLSGTSVLSRQVNYKMNDLMLLSLRGQDDEGTVVLDSISYHQSVSGYRSYPDLVLVEIKAERRGETLAVRRAIIRKSESGVKQ